MDEELVPVFVGSPQDAELLRAALAGSGIEATVEASGIGAAYPVNVGDLAKTKLLVRAEDAERARDVLAAGDLEPSDPRDHAARPAGPSERDPAALRILVGRTLVGLALAVLIVTVAAWLGGGLRSLIP